MTIEELAEQLGITLTDANRGQVTTSLNAYVTAQTSTLKANRDQLLKDVKNLKNQLKAFEGLDGAELATALEELGIGADDIIDRLRAPPPGDPKNPDVAKQIADAVAAAEAKLQRKIAAAEKKAADAEGALAIANKARVDETIERALTGELATQKGNVDLLLPMLRGRVKGEIGEDGKVSLTVLAANGDEMLGTNGASGTVALLVETIKRDEKFGIAFEADGGGSGSRPNTQRNSGRKNPWKKETFNLTEQSSIRAENPALADQLKREAEMAA